MRFLCLFVALQLALSAQPAGQLVPIEKFAQDATFSRARLSPDGRYIAYLRMYEDEQTLFILDLAGKKLIRVDPGRTRSGLAKEIGAFRWIGDRRISFITTVWDGQYYTGVTAVDADGKRWVAYAGPDVNPRDSNPLLARTIIHSFDDKEQSVLMLDMGSGEGKDRFFPDVVRVNTLAAQSRIVVKNPGNVGAWVADHAGVVRLGITRDGIRYGVIIRESEQAPWRQMPLFDEARGKIQPLGFDRSGQRLLVAADNATKRRAVYYYDLASGQLGAEIASHAEFDIILEMGSASVDGNSLVGPITSELTDEVIGIRYLTDGPRVQWFDPGFARLHAKLSQILPDTVNLLVSRSRAEDRFLVYAFSDRDPGTYYLIDLQGEKPSLARLGTHLADFPVAAMVPMYPIKYPARDGTTIHGYLTLPPGGKKQGLPLIVMPHGGPFVRDTWEFDRTVQFLASRGYAVLQMNFRGSPGYGVDFFHKGKKEIGRGMQDDIEDGTRWAIAQGVADPGRIALVGGSYGGYATLYALAHNPELYRCGVSFAGVTDWAELVQGKRGEEYRFAYAYFREFIADPKHAAAFLAEISPVNFAAKITAPVLLVQGKEDRIVPPKQARKMVAALEKIGRPPQTIYFPDVGHGFTKAKDRVKYYTALEQFLAQHLAPK